MESVADWYSQNLGSETAKGKKERSHQGIHNNRPPFGMKKNEEKILVPDESELPGLILAFESYATGKYSDRDIAHLLNEAGYKSKTGRPFSKDTVRSVLQNRPYLGEIKYQKYKRHSNGKRSFEAPIELFEGQHEAVIDKELFEKCQEVRAGRRAHRQATKRFNHYLLRNLVYCYRCCSNPPEGKTFQYYGKMRGQSQWNGNHLYYRCRASDLGYECEQKGVVVEDIDNQVINTLMTLKPPKTWREGVTQTMSELLGEKGLEERLDEIRAIIKRMDIRWDHGFFADEDEYMQQRIKLQLELEQLTPVPMNDLEHAADLLENFQAHWEQLQGKPEAQHELVKLIVERVYVKDDKLVAMTLRSNYHLVLGHNGNGPTYHQVDPLYAHGSDGTRSLTCITVLILLPKHISVSSIIINELVPVLA